ncbi:MAG: FAD-dependent oxidoreductase [Gammaproteobacteria bacterium]|nr:FAD-dependent oxidoreductase [Gammaproteobacteria bacterium]
MMFQKLSLLTLISLVIGSFYFFNLGDYFTLEAIKSHQNTINAYYQESPVITILAYFIIYIIVAALSLPGATILTLAGGFIFGNLYGFLIISFASTIGATFAFLMARFLIKNWVEKQFSTQLNSINQGIDKEGIFYLLSLRLIPIFPFFMVNLLMGLTRMKTLTYFWVSQLGMIPGTLVYINAGTQVSKIETLQDIISPAILLSFTLLGLLPWLSKFLIQVIKNKRLYKNYNKPKHFDYNLIVIGAGAGGLVSAYIAAAVKAKVALIEKHKMGGDCLNTGCVPSKTLIHIANIAYQAREANKLGINLPEPEVNFKKVMQQVHQAIQKIEPHDSIERYSALGVDVIEGKAKISSPYQIEVNNQTLTSKNIIIASGAQPYIPELAGLNQINYLTSDNLWQLNQLPENLLILGGGPIGCELAQAFKRLGSKVTIIQRNKHLLPREDSDISDFVKTQFEQEGINIKLEHQAVSIDFKDNKKYLVCSYLKQNIEVEFSDILIALGRQANTENFGLQDLQIPLRANKTLETNELLQSNYPNIYAVGDVTGPFQFTHVAAHQAWYASVNALFGSFKKFKVDYRFIPWATFTDPEIARVGLNEQQAKENNIAYELSCFDLSDLDRAITDNKNVGLIKVLTVPGKDKILGVSIAGEHAAEIIVEFVTAMKYGLGLNKILSTPHIYPTFAETNKYVAGQWKKKQTSETILAWLKKYHHWTRN